MTFFLTDTYFYMKKALIISDSIPGHFNQSIGIYSLLNEEMDFELSIVEMKWKVRVFRSVFKIIGRKLCKNLSIKKSRLILTFFENIDIEGCDLLIAAGGNTFPINAALSKLYGIPNIQLGSPRGISSNLFNVHLTSERYSDSLNNIVYEITPNKYSPKNCINKSTCTNKILFLFGGNGMGYSYSQKDVIDIIQSLNNLTKKFDKEIICVTSRRSNKNYEKLLKSSLNNLSNDSIWFHAGGENADLSKLFSISKYIYVTEDSAMMISESISSGKKVTTIYPEDFKCPQRYLNQINSYLDKGFIQRKKIGQDLEINSVDFQTSNIEISRSTLRQKILKNLNYH